MGPGHLLSHLDSLVYVCLVVVASRSELPGTILAFFGVCKAVVACLLLLHISLLLAELLFQIGNVVRLDTFRIVHGRQELVWPCCRCDFYLESTVTEAPGSLASILLSKWSRETIAIGVFIHLLDGHRLQQIPLSANRASARPRYFVTLGINESSGVDCHRSLTGARLRCHRCILNFDLSLTMPARVFSGLRELPRGRNILVWDLVHILCWSVLNDNSLLNDMTLLRLLMQKVCLFIRTIPIADAIERGVLMAFMLGLASFSLRFGIFDLGGT